MTRAWMEARADTLGIDHDADMSDDDLATELEDRIEEIVVPLNVATADAVKQREFADQFPEQARLLSELSAKERDNSLMRSQRASHVSRVQRRAFLLLFVRRSKLHITALQLVSSRRMI